MLRTDASAIPIELACSDLLGITRPSSRHSKNKFARIWGDKALAISGYQIVFAANRTVKNIISMSVVESRIQEMQWISALHTSQSMGASSKTRVGGVTIAASGICSASSPMAEMQRRLLNTLQIPGRRNPRIRPRFLVKGKDVMSDPSERVTVRYLRAVRVRIEGV